MIVTAPLDFPEVCRFQMLGETRFTAQVVRILGALRPLARFAGHVGDRAALTADYLVVCDLAVPGAAALVGTADPKVLVMPLPVGDVWSYWALADDVIDYIRPGPTPSLDDDDLLQTMIAIERAKVQPGTGQILTRPDAFLVDKTDWLAPNIDRIMQVFERLGDAASHDVYKMLIAGRPPMHWAYYIGRLFKTVQYFELVNYDACQVVLNGGVFAGEELPLLSAHLPAGATVHNVDPLGHDHLDPYVRPWVEHARCNFVEHRVALAKDDGELILHTSGNGQVSVGQSGAPQAYPARSIDSLAKEMKLERLDLIKLDLEGGDVAALCGACQSIMRYRPQLALSIYHSINEFWDIPHFMFQLCPDYDFYIRNYSCERWETILYGIPKEVAALRQAA